MNPHGAKLWREQIENEKKLIKLDVDCSPAELRDYYYQLKELVWRAMIGIEVLNDHQKALASWLRDHTQGFETLNESRNP